MMNVLVTIETAKLAQQKGFYTVCDNYFLVALKENKLIEIGKWKGFEGSSGNQFLERSNDIFEEISRPTQALLQQWLRKKYNIHTTPLETFTHALITNIGFYARVIKPNPTSEDFLDVLYHSEYFDGEYETALEIGLLEGLKTITNETLR